MRVLYVNSAAGLGGAEHSLLELVRTLATQGVEAQAAVPPGPLADALGAAGVTVHTLPLHRLRRPRCPVTAMVSAATLAADSLRLLRLLRHVRPDLVHANGSAAALAAAPAARWLGIPCVWHCRDLAPPGARLLTRLCSRVVAISASVARSLPASPKRIVIPNGIDLTRFDPALHPRSPARARLGLAPDASLVTMVAEFVPWKRHDLFLATAAEIRRARPDVRFAVAGGDTRGDHPELATQLRAQSEALGLTDVLTWLGHCPDTAPVYAATDVLLHPASCEPFGRVVCEALAMGCAVVVADTGGPAELVADCPAGRAVPPMPTALGGAVLEMLTAPGEVRSGRAHVVWHYSLDRLAADVAALYAALLPAVREP